MVGKRELAQVSTPENILDFMVSLASPDLNGAVLEPGCGSAPFLRRVRDAFGSYKMEFFGVEIDREAASEAPDWVRLYTEDFLTWEPGVNFSLVIGNPPYGIVGSEEKYPIHSLLEKKAIYKSLFSTWKGKYNLYGAFVEKGVKLLRPKGMLIYVIPASWLVLDDFSLLRSFLARSGANDIYYLGEVFEGKKVSAVVLMHQKSAYPGKLRLWDVKVDDRGKLIPTLWLEKGDWGGEMVRFENDFTRELEGSGPSVGRVYEIRFAARSNEFKKNPEVRREQGPGLLPVLTGRNLKPEKIDYDTNYSGLWVSREVARGIREFYDHQRLVVGHTKGTKVVAAWDERAYPWREEFHLIPKEGWFPKPDDVVVYLNSDLVSRYVKILYRDFVPHLTLRMLERIPLMESFFSSTPTRTRLDEEP